MKMQVKKTVGDIVGKIIVVAVGSCITALLIAITTKLILWMF